MIPEKTDQRQQIAYDGPKGDYHEWRLLVSDALRDAGYITDADSFWDCAADQPTYFIPHHRTLPDDTDTKSLYVCLSDRNHRVKAVRCTCHLRICPDCAKRASARLLARYMPKCRELILRRSTRYQFRKVVLTTDLDLRSPDVAIQYQKLRKLVPKLFDSLLLDTWRYNQGVIVSDEFGPEGHKLHFHVIFYGSWLENRAGYEKTISSEWSRLTDGHGEITWIGLVKPADVENEVVEALKYATKFWKSDTDGNVIRLDPELVVILHELLDGVRRVRSYGIFYKLPAPADRDPVCPDCQSPVLRLSVTEWNIFAQSGWLPDEQSLHLRLGNKSPPTDRGKSDTGPPIRSDLGPVSSKSSQPVLVGMPEYNTHYQNEG